LRNGQAKKATLKSIINSPSGRSLMRPPFTFAIL
jgi:hypothetical protein